jgi:cytochrome c553
MARVLGCRGCHDDALTGHAWIDDPNVAMLYTSNLTRAVPEYSDAQLARAIREGVRHDGSPLWDMPSDIFTDLSGDDLAPLIAWLRTVPPAGAAHPRIVVGPEGRRRIARGELRPMPDLVRENRSKGPPPLDGRHDWARYMIRATCAECHKLDLTGWRGEEGPRSPPDLIVASGYTREQFRRLMRTGLPPDGRDLGLMKQVSERRFAHLTPREVDAIYDYLAARAAAPQ